VRGLNCRKTFDLLSISPFVARPSVCQSHAVSMPKQLNISLAAVPVLVVPLFLLSENWHSDTNILDRASNTGGHEKLVIRPISAIPRKRCIHC